MRGFVTVLSRSRGIWPSLGGVLEFCNIRKWYRIKRAVSVGAWLSLVEHLLREQGVGGSNPLAPTISVLPNQWGTSASVAFAHP